MFSKYLLEYVITMIFKGKCDKRCIPRCIHANHAGVNVCVHFHVQTKTRNEGRPAYISDYGKVNGKKNTVLYGGARQASDPWGSCFALISSITCLTHSLAHVYTCIYVAQTVEHWLVWQTGTHVYSRIARYTGVLCSSSPR